MVEVRVREGGLHRVGRGSAVDHVHRGVVVVVYCRLVVVASARGVVGGVVNGVVDMDAADVQLGALDTESDTPPH